MAGFIKLVIWCFLFAAGLGFYVHYSTGYLHQTYDADLMRLVDWLKTNVTPGLGSGSGGLGGPILPRAGG